MRHNQNGFKSDQIGEYYITDSIVNEGFFDALNELYNPVIILETDTSIVVTAQLKIVISEQMIISRKLYSGYMHKTFFDSLSNKNTNEIDTIIFLGDTVKFVSKEQIDTLFNTHDQDIIRKFQGGYLLNKWHEEGYQPILLTKSQGGLLRLMDIENNYLVKYYWSFFTDKMDNKADLVNNGFAIELKNSELKHLVKNNYFTIRYLLKKIN